MIRTLVVVPALLLSLAGGAAAQDSARSASPSPDTPAVAAPTPASSQAGQAVAPAQARDGRVAVPPASEKALRYQRSGNVLWVVDTLWGCWSRWCCSSPACRRASATWRGGWGGRGTSRWWSTAPSSRCCSGLVSLPLAYYEGFVREHAVRALHPGRFGKWLGDSLKSMAIGIVGFALVMWIPYLLLRKSPRRWWLWTASRPSRCWRRPSGSSRW
jgi:STE24 endopeptidase